MSATATLLEIAVGQGLHGPVFLLVAECDQCGKTVTHGGGHDPATVTEFLGHRAAHCACPQPAGYELVDPAGITTQLRTRAGAA